MADEVWRNIQNRLQFLVQFRFFPQRTPGNRGAFSTCYRRTISTKWVQNVVKTKKVSACAPSFSEILFGNVDYLTRKCATWPRRFQYTESTNHPEHPCAVRRPQPVGTDGRGRDRGLEARRRHGAVSRVDLRPLGVGAICGHGVTGVGRC